MQKTLEQLKESIITPLKYPHLASKLKLPLPKGILIKGPSGSGKSLLVKVLAAETGCVLVESSGSQLIGTFVGETEKGLRKLYEDANASGRPTIILLDEIVFFLLFFS
jgi:ATP-dependent 26S proteasome regulatory subunit